LSLQLEKFCHLTADGIHETLLRPEHGITQDYLKFLDHSMLFERMHKKINRDYASTYSNVCTITVVLLQTSVLKGARTAEALYT